MDIEPGISKDEVSAHNVIIGHSLLLGVPSKAGLDIGYCAALQLAALNPACGGIHADGGIAAFDGTRLVP